MPQRGWLVGLIALTRMLAVAVAAAGEDDEGGGGRIVHRSPVAVAASPDGRWIATANRDSGTVSLLDAGSAAGVAIDEIAVGRRPAAIVARGGNGFVTVAEESGDLVLLDVAQGRLEERGRFHVGFEPTDVALSPDGTVAWVPLSAAASVVSVDLATLSVSARLEVPPLPRHVALSPDGSTVAVTSATGAILLVDAAEGGIRSSHSFKGLNVGQPAFTPDGATVYFPFTYDGGGFTSPGDIRRGWVTGSRIGRLSIGPDGGELSGLTLDVSGRAVGDVRSIAVVDGGRTLLVTAGGTHEVLRFDAGSDIGLPWTQISGTEVMDRSLAADGGRFRRVDLGGRPLGTAVAANGGHLLVANPLLDAVQIVPVSAEGPVVSLRLPPGAEPTPEEALVRRGEAIFYDARRSLDQWYSCHTCHWEGGGNTVTFDTLNDGSVGTYKSVLPLWRLADTGPWTWHGWQQDLTAAVKKSMIDTMQAPEPEAADVEALTAFLAGLRPPPSPFRGADGGLSEAAERGRRLFESSRAGCSDCHPAPFYTAPDLHDVGLARKEDRHPSFSPPTLLAGFRKTRWLHSAKARSLHELLSGPHSPQRISGEQPLTDAEVDDLVAWLKSL